MTQPSISLIICTHRPTNTFRRMLESLDRLEHRERCEIVMVENACTPKDSTMIDACLSTRPFIRLVHEPVRGLSIARNRGIRESTAPIVAFMDDDAELSPDWIEAMLGAFTDHEKTGAAGGKIVLEHLSPPPAWITPLHCLFMGAFDCGNQVQTLSYPHYPRGLNMAFSREALERIGGFSPHLGKIGQSLMCFEEIDICYRLAEQGWTILYVPDALATHLIEPFRYEPSWYTRRSYAQGKSVRIFERLRGKTGRPLTEVIRSAIHGNALDRSQSLGYLIGSIVPL